MPVAHLLPAVNASLNALSGVFPLIGYVLIRRKRVQAHKRFMLAACTTSLVFLVCYVTNHYLRHGIVTHFTGTGIIRPIYLAILISHPTLRVVILPLAIV